MVYTSAIAKNPKNIEKLKSAENKYLLAQQLLLEAGEEMLEVKQEEGTKGFARLLEQETGIIKAEADRLIRASVVASKISFGLAIAIGQYYLLKLHPKSKQVIVKSLTKQDTQRTVVAKITLPTSSTPKDTNWVYVGKGFGREFKTPRVDQITGRNILELSQDTGKCKRTIVQDAIANYYKSYKDKEWELAQAEFNQYIDRQSA
jgi:hypothetical protein